MLTPLVICRVFNILKGWLNNGYYDFQSDPNLKGALLDFIDTQMAVSLKNPAQTLLSLIEKKVITPYRDEECEVNVIIVSMHRKIKLKRNMNIFSLPVHQSL